LRRIKFERITLVLCHVVLFLIFGNESLHSQEFLQSEILNEKLSEVGFENVSSAINDSSIFIAVENRRFRDNGRAIAEVIQLVDEDVFIENYFELNIILLYQKVPMLLIKLSLEEFQSLKNKIIDFESFESKLLVTSDFKSAYDHLESFEIYNRSQFKADLVVIPQVRTQFGDFDNPVQSSINLIPELNIQLAKGLSFKGQYIIPLQNDFYFDEEGKVARPGNITLNQFVRLEDDFYINATAGFFDKNRAGANLEIRKVFADGRFSVGSNIGFTTGYSYTGYRTVYLDYEKYLTALLDLEYRYVPFDLTGSLQAGNFLYNSLGVRFDVVRQFGEVNIGFFALAASGEINGGFKIAIPLPPRKYTKIKYARVRPSQRFNWEYRAKGFPRSGTMYNTGHSLYDLFLDINPSQIKNQIIRELEKKF